MTDTRVLVANASADDILAQLIVEAVAERADMILVSPVPVEAKTVEAALGEIPDEVSCAVVVLGRDREAMGRWAQRWLAKRPDLVVLQVDVVGDNVRFDIRNPGLAQIVSALRNLAARVCSKRVDTVQIRTETNKDASPGSSKLEPVKKVDKAPATEESAGSVLDTARQWVHSVLEDAVRRLPENERDTPGVALSKSSTLEALGQPIPDPPDADSLSAMLSAPNAATAPLGILSRSCGFDPTDLQLLLLALAPEFDVRFHRCIVLLDEMGRRTGTPGLYSHLLGDSGSVRKALAEDSALRRWLLFEGPPPTADEPLRVDPYITQWLMGDRHALACDPRVSRLLRRPAWPGATLIKGQPELEQAEQLMARINGDHPQQGPQECYEELVVPPRWLVLGGDHPAEWRAMVELGSQHREPLRVETARLASIDASEMHECGWRLARLAMLSHRPLIVDTAAGEQASADDSRLEQLLFGIDQAGGRAALICLDRARAVRQLGQIAFEMVNDRALRLPARVEAFGQAARETGAFLTAAEAESISNRYPLELDSLELAVHLANSRPKENSRPDPAEDRFVVSCRDVAAEGLSRLADRIEPVFRLDNIVLPADRKRQLVEIADHVRLAPKVLDAWKFRDQLPYGRGVTALFFGPSGTGKTMAAMGIARELGIQLLRLDLSRVVSKYIGDTEKNIDRIFVDAQRSGSAILIDEADALLGKRSEVKDAHDRYANIEVAYLLQRMEAFDGLAILTTNFRQNLDSAFLRRLRFIIEFPRPDVASREQIWRFCLPVDSHRLDNAAFRQLARRIDLTGGHIRQITLRAAFLAAAEDSLIGLEQIAAAAGAEFAKLGMPPVELDLGDARRAA